LEFPMIKLLVKVMLLVKEPSKTTEAPTELKKTLLLKTMLVEESTLAFQPILSWMVDFVMLLEVLT
jgi:hypothetical protein